MGSLTRSRDRKTANAVSPNGKRPTIANAFGLPAGPEYSCPGATEFCRDCYGLKTERVYRGVSKILLHNWELLKDASRADMVILLDEMMASFVKDCAKRDAPKMFRIHWDGDFFSPIYVTAWAMVIASYPDVQFWAYTRVATAALFLHSQRLSNLSLYFSADRFNLSVARHVGSKGVLIAYAGESFAEGKAALPGAPRCPENNRALPLISVEGSACMRCGLCVHGRSNVLFSTTKK